MAPRTAGWKVVYSTDVYLQKPVDMARSRRGLFYESADRGPKLATGDHQHGVAVVRLTFT